MRNACTIHGPGNLVHSVGVVLEKAGFDVAAVVRNGDEPGQMFVSPRMATIIVLDGANDTVSYTESHTHGVSTTIGTHTAKLKARRGRPRKHPVPTLLDKQDVQESPPATPGDDDLPF